MPVYRYKALDVRGDLLEGQMEAASEAEVAARLQEQGHVPVEASLSNGDAVMPSLRNFLGEKPFSGLGLIHFTQQLAALLGAGQPLDRALSILTDLPDNEKSRRIIGDVCDIVRGGTPLSIALERQHGVFSRLYVTMARAGESGGNMPETLQRLADYLERNQVVRAKVINALIYPVILIFVVGGALAFLLGYVVPQFGAMYESLDVALPWFTQGVLALGHFIGDWWFLLLAVIGIGMIFVERKRRDVAFRARFDTWLLRQRLLGTLIVNLETARLARTLGTLLRNGVPLLSALRISRNVLSNAALVDDLGSVAEDVKNGLGLAGALGRGKRFPRLAVQMIQVGEESGTLDTMLLKAASSFEQESTVMIDRLLAALVPAITLVMAMIIAVVILSVLVPLYDLTNSIG
ncbi:type II secretion system F family protein [Xylella fastidiosa subsp. multiplex]|uniref:Type II secretion system F family protein n=1 Tax=Xylella fastidiosa subsp. multiplex TaxID=644357 RepID=A0A9Q4MGX7_XYLFS|nr:type II secretion system F family protein [Xylella fastidiosa]KAJ4852888.1 type II secretion system F family protein [Xylella fastidiosa subsp. multiplex]MBE0268933.1 type II secretion system F family protein [Xylella fastidiosa subsp. multiplex]MBE0275672.1 type II secretion system F family protein [Xylella fastidiosa subsp. multiplex]MBE0277819.1 type II secretion system F family protein [Xylella fastidiosa subsp. multiplex]MBE0282092.1 type II secretion system F family protein [Xylella f